MISVLTAFLTAFATGLLLLPITVRLVKKLKAGQPILSYVDNHKSKSGTPTMGGVAIVLALFTVLIVSKRTSSAAIILIVTTGYALIGFIDDFIKVRYKNNKGLSAAQKLVFQVTIAVIVAIYAYYSPKVGSKVFAPFVPVLIDLGAFAPFYFVFVFLAFTNSVNLTDGLDGLAASVTATNTVFICAILAIPLAAGVIDGSESDVVDMIILSSALCGALLAFLCYNTHPAKIFMGDTGSMALGGFLASVAVLGKMSLSMLLIGIMYIITSFSVILQVAVFKTTGKRVLLMSPLHHHFERKGVFEGKIAVVYTLVTFVCGIATVLLMLSLY